MKKHYLFLPVAMAFILIVATSGKFTTGNKTTEPVVNLPDNVKSIVENKCIGCHSKDSKSDKAKEKLLFDSLDSLSKAKLVFTYGKIDEVMEEGKMPPEKFLEKFPDKKLTDGERETLKTWAINSAEDMLK